MDKQIDEQFDLVVIGSGPGGYPAAIRAAQHGKKVALIEAKELGGTCLNRGCIPSKALIACAELLQEMKNSEKFGISCSGLFFDYQKMVERKDKIVTQIRNSLKQLLLANQIQIIQGFASFKSAKELVIQGEDLYVIRADKIIISSGSEPKSTALFTCDQKYIVDSTALLEKKTLPKKMIIIGGGVIGCEFASLYQILGVEVTIIEKLPSILAAEAISLSQFLTKEFKQRSIQLITQADIEKISVKQEKVEVLLKDLTSYQADLCLIAIGREMNLADLKLENAGIYLNDLKAIPVNAQMETAVAGIYAVGDIASKWWLAHVATHQGLIAADHACGKSVTMRYEAIPNVIFTSPEMASVGLSLEEAKIKGYQASLGQFPMQALGKAQASGHTKGFAQIVIDEITGQILGAQVVCTQASSLIAALTLAINNELTIECLTETIHAHPTFPEAFLEAGYLASNTPLHLPPQREKIKAG